jgi:hypothetical protein
LQQQPEKSKKSQTVDECESALTRILNKILDAFFAAGLPDNTRLLDAFETYEAISRKQEGKPADSSRKPITVRVEGSSIFGRLGDA